MESNREGVAVKNRGGGDGGGGEQTTVTKQQSINNLSTVPIRRHLGAMIDRNCNPPSTSPFQVTSRFCGGFVARARFSNEKPDTCTIEKFSI